jgi:hypothetical protein
VYLLRDQRDELDSRLAASNESRFSRLSGTYSIDEKKRLTFENKYM